MKEFLFEVITERVFSKTAIIIFIKKYRMRVEEWFIIFVAISACWVAIFVSSIKIFPKTSYGVIHGK